MMEPLRLYTLDDVRAAASTLWHARCAQRARLDAMEFRHSVGPARQRYYDLVSEYEILAALAACLIAGEETELRGQRAPPSAHEWTLDQWADHLFMKCPCRSHTRDRERWMETLRARDRRITSWERQ